MGTLTVVSTRMSHSQQEIRTISKCTHIGSYENFEGVFEDKRLLKMCFYDKHVFESAIVSVVKIFSYLLMMSNTNVMYC